MSEEQFNVNVGKMESNNLKRKLDEEDHILPEKKKSFSFKLKPPCDLLEETPIAIIKSEPMDDDENQEHLQTDGEKMIEPIKFVQVKEEENATDMSMDKIEVKKEPMDRELEPDTHLENNSSGSSFSTQVKPKPKMIKILKIPQNLINSKNLLSKAFVLKMPNSSVKGVIPKIHHQQIKSAVFNKITPTNKEGIIKSILPKQHKQTKNAIFSKNPPSNKKTEPTFNVNENEPHFALSNSINLEHQQMKDAFFNKESPTNPLKMFRESEETEPPYSVKEDQAIFALATFLPKDEVKKVAKNVSDHIVGRSEKSITDRLKVITKNLFLYEKPMFLFEIELEVEDEKGSISLVKMVTILLESLIVVLKCKKGRSCVGYHPCDSIKIPYDPSSESGINEATLYEYLIKNAHVKNLRLPEQLDDFKSLMKQSGVSLHADSQSHIINPSCLRKYEEKLFSLNKTKIIPMEHCQVELNIKQEPSDQNSEVKDISLDIKQEPSEQDSQDNHICLDVKQEIEAEIKKEIVEMEENFYSSDIEFNTYSCGQCEYKAKWKGNLKIHIDSTHEHIESINENITLSCDKCEYKTKFIGHFKIHIETRHGDITCPDCGYKAKERGTLNRHIKAVHGNMFYSCEQCDYKATQKSSLKRHIDTMHENIITYFCVQCEYKTIQKQDLEKHMASIHSNESTNEDLTYPMGCEYTTEYTTEHIGHFKTHIKTGDTTCPHCGYEAKDKGTLNQHIKGIHGNVTYSCGQCDHKTKWKGELKRHIESIHGNVTYPCDQCEYKSTRRDDLQRHIQSFHEKVTYSCEHEQCNYKATLKGNLKRHYNTVHT